MSMIAPDVALGKSLYRLPIGAFNELIFECSRERVFTFDDYKREAKGRYAKHELINQPPASEFLGADLGQIEFKMIFSADLGVNPSEEANRVRQLCANGVADYLIIANEVIGNYQWVIESVSEEVRASDESGRVIVSSVKVTMKEYVESLPQ